jgi:hypothetical protein
MRKKSQSVFAKQTVQRLRRLLKKNNSALKKCDQILLKMYHKAEHRKR